jgi:hypothetical protein
VRASSLPLVALIGTTLGCAPPVRFVDRAILWHWPDDRPIAMPRPRPLSLLWADVRDGVFAPADRVLSFDYLREAEGINALDEVPDSAWFFDPRRIEGDPRPRVLPAADLAWGALSPDDAPELPLRIIEGKETGDTPGFVALDARGRKFMIKLDPSDHLGLATSTERVVTELAWVAGWRVPGEILLDAFPEQIELAPGAIAKDAFGGHHPFTVEALDVLLAHAPRTAQGAVRLLASAWLPGVALGPFAYSGRVRDDPNDLVEHQDRRDLRGLGVFAAWVNDIDALQQNTLDMYEGPPGRGHVVHYQQDLGGSLGSYAGTTAPHWMGSETFFEVHLLIRSLFTLGLWPRRFDDWSYKQAKNRLAAVWPELGNFEADGFDPHGWRPVWENPAFARQTARDRYWGAKRVISIGDDALKAIIATGRYRPAAATRLYEVLATRREKIARAFFADMAPLDRFRVLGDRLCFDDLWLEAGLGGAAATSYSAGAFAGIHRRPLGAYPVSEPAPGLVISRCVALPADDGYRVVALAARRPGDRRPGPTVWVHLVVERGRGRIIGIER